MARSMTSAVPMAGPLSKRERNRIKRWGRKDAKINTSGSTTATHAVLVLKNLSERGQNEVNTWLINECKPQETGNAAILVQCAAGISRINAMREKVTTTQRGAKQLAETIAIEKEKLDDAVALYNRNLVLKEANHMTAEQAIDSWRGRYEEATSIYSRALANKAERDVASVSAEVPVFHGVPLVEVGNPRDIDEELMVEVLKDLK